MSQGRDPQSVAAFLGLLVCQFAWGHAISQTEPVAPTAEKASPVVSAPASNKEQEAFVFEHIHTKLRFENDGTETRETQASIQIRSDAAVQRWGVVSFSYQNFNQTLEIAYVRVKKPDGTMVLTPPENTQDITSEISRVAPFYTDQREKHVAVKGLAPGDVLEYSCTLRVTKPLIPGKFWFEYDFEHDQPILDESLEISVPSGRPIKLKNRGPKYETTDEDGHRIYRWKYSNPQRNEEKEEDEGAVWKQARGRQDQPDLLVSSFNSWDEVGRWYEELQHERVKPTSEIRAKATELTNGAPDDLSKVQAIYKFVSTKYRYIGIALGMGRYQPHSAVDVLDNGYGDCKDKHTLLASLLTAAGFKVYPALIHSQRDIDPDVPSPGQFNHVISVIALGDHKVWLDTTAEVAPFGFLLSPLRGKHALVISAEEGGSLQTTPENPATKSGQTFEMKAELADDGTLTGEVQRTTAGSDLEVLLRSGFRSLGMPQWKDLVQRISNGSGFGGDVSNVSASPPEDIGEPFRISYTYTRKNYSDWENRRISPPLPVMYLPEIKEGKKAAKYPMWLGVPGEVRFHCTVELPKNYTPDLPKNINVKEDFAEYHTEYSVKDGILITDRQLVFFVSEVQGAEYEKYKAFLKQVNNDRDVFISLSSPSAPTRDAVASNQSRVMQARNEMVRAMWELPSSDDPVAAQYENEARDAVMRNDIHGAITSLRSAVNKDPKFARGWLLLGSILSARLQQDFAIEAYRNAVSADPSRAISYKLLGFALMSSRKYEEAISAWQTLSKIAPKDHEAQANLGNVLMTLKRYSEAASAFEAAAKLMPDKVSLHTQLGSAHLGAGDDEKARAAFQEAIKLDSSTLVLNNVAYEMAERNMDLNTAQEYAEKAVHEEEQICGKLRISELNPSDLTHAETLSMFWDTLGWVYFRQNDLTRAEKYLSAAWKLSQDPTEGRHLAKVYERQGKKAAALHLFQLAHSAAPLMIPTGPGLARTADDDGSPDDDLKRLGDKPDRAAAVTELSQMRTFALPRIVHGTASANFIVLLGPGKKVEAKFVSGADSLKIAEKTIAGADYKFTLPDDSPARVPRSGIAGCYPYSGCSIVFMTASTNFLAPPNPE